jgi:hypothetical protein
VLSVFAKICIFCKETVEVRASVAILWCPMFVLRDSIAFDMNDNLLNSCIHSEHPHYIHDFAFVMNDDFLYSFIRSNIHTTSIPYPMYVVSI